MKIAVMSMAHHHAEAYVEILKKRSDVELVGLTDDNSLRGEKFASLYKIPWFESYESLLDENPDAVLICSENSRHRKHFQLASEKGCAVFCEKPIATTVKDAKEMASLQKKNSTPFMTAFPMRFSPPALELTRNLHEGRIGRVLCINGKNQGQMPAHHRKWFIDPVLAGGGAVMDHTVHLADMYRWMLEKEVTEVYARANRILYADELEVETAGLLMLTFTDGTFASVDCSWSRPRLYPTWGGLSMEVVGEKGVINMDAFRQKIEIYGDSEMHYAHDFWGDDINAAMIDEFINAVKNNRSPSIGLNDGLQALRIVDAAYRSIKSGDSVKLIN